MAYSATVTKKPTPETKTVPEVIALLIAPFLNSLPWALFPFPYMGAYAATKAFVLSFSESLWAENRHLGIRVLALCPGATKTGFFDVVGTSNMPGGVTGTPQSVVRNAFRGLEKNRSYVVDGIGNYWIANSARFVTRKFMVAFSERLGRPASKN